jgi:secretion/DNA translocation related CpaE-like protein
MDADFLLLVTRDPLLPGRVAEQLPRPRAPLSAAMSMTVLDDVRAVRRAWSSAGHVLVDADLVTSLRRARLPLRPRVALVLPVGTDPVNWEDAVALGIDRMLEPDDLGAWLADQAVRAAPAAAPAPAPAPTSTPTSTSQGRLIVVTGACGGSGASTLAAALAVQTSGARVLVDLDRAGGGIDLVLGLEEQPGPRWPEALAAAPDVLALFDALPTTADGLAVLSHDGRSSDPAGASPGAGPDVEAVAQVLEAARRRYDLVVADLTRDSRSDLLPATAREDAVVLLVVPPDIRGCAAALHRSRTLDDWPDLRLVVGPRPGPTLDEVTVGVGLDLPVVGVLPYDPTVPAAAARGEPPGGTRRSSYGRAVAALIPSLDGSGRP